MNPEEWRDIKEKLEPAFASYAGGHHEMVEELARAHPHLRGEIEELLASHLQMNTGFLNVAETAEEPENGHDVSMVGRQLGPYQVIEQIGKGGMGEVYRAVRVDDQYRKQVAIKLVRAGNDSPFVVARFRNERQILANLEHHNVARLLDGGATAEGTPYLVMELVEGETINEYCDGHHLNTTQRLKLFLHVCNAVQYAHQRLIVHRDIKPSNILVNSEGVPKLLDFGIAKILNPQAAGPVENTITVFRLLTPGYASPEQIRGEAITTSTDVYSLGVVLYELLSGHAPYGPRSRNAEEIARSVCESDPDRPSAVITRPVGGDEALSPAEIGLMRDGSVQKVRKRLRGDLDNIVLMALRKEPQRRYSSVELFATDIRRHLDNLPVIARGDSRRYRARKFIARNKPAVLAASIVFFTLIVGLAVTLREARIARAERARAEQRFRDVREIANSDLFELHDAIKKLPGSGSVRNLVIQRALKYLEKLSRDASGDREVMHELATGYERIADLQGNFSGPGIGDTSAALTSYQKAIALREALAAPPRGDLAETLAEVKTMVSYVHVLEVAGRTGDASRGAEKAFAICERLSRDHQLDASTQAVLAGAHLGVAIVLGGSGSSSTVRKIPEAIQNDQAALSLLGAIRETQDPLVRSLNVKARFFLAFHLNKARRFRESEQLFDEIIAAARSASAPKSILEGLFEWRGIMLERSGAHAKALADFEADRDASEAMVRAEPDNIDAATLLQIANAHIAIEKFRLGRKDADMQPLNTAVAIGERLYGANPAEHFYRNLLTG
jgi:serine/threonine protein kinase